MFTGLVTDVGVVTSVKGSSDVRVTIQMNQDPKTIATGASIACNGVCLTVVDKGPNWFAADVSPETQHVTTLSDWEEGRLVNIERSLRLGDEMGGHMVSGHVDCVGRVEGFEVVDHDGCDVGSKVLSISAPSEYGHLLVKKGSICVDGISLTVNDVIDDNDHTHFTINVIPHTQAVTSLKATKTGDPVNLEFDIVARYVARLSERVSASV